MNNYPIWWDTAVTVYNRFEDAQTHIIKWYRHTISGCFWRYVGDKITIGETVLETNNIICRMPKSDIFLEKYQWIAVPNDQMDDYFTLSPRDIIVKGEVSDIIDEYTKGHRASDILAKYKALQGCMEIQEVAINVGPGRVNEHYFVRGI